jgi:hypothetical protein
MSTISPRAVFVVRETEYTMLRARHVTREQSRFYLRARGQTLDEIELRHQKFESALHHCRSTLPADWRQALVYRSDFDRFLFGPEDVIIAVGQDGLVANIAKYLDGQPVFGINPDPDQYDGVLVRFSPDHWQDTLARWAGRQIRFEQRAMVEARLESGEHLLALNEIFIGHSTHQSARYLIKFGDHQEVHSSSGIIISSGTGTTGWARSIMEATRHSVAIQPDEKRLAFFVREPFPSIATKTDLQSGELQYNDSLQVTSMMNDGGTIFADGIEKDRLAFDWGRIASIGLSQKCLNLAVG